MARAWLALDPSNGACARLSEHAGRRASSIVSGCILLAHTLFAYAQISGMWTECGPLPPLGPGPCEQGVPLDPGGLMRADLDVHVEWEAAGLLEAGLNALTTDLCLGRGDYHSCPAGRHTPLPSGNASEMVCGALECGGLDYRSALLHISYFYSIDHLWITPSPDGVSYPGRPAAGMLFTWSFLWPHVKLLLLHGFFYAATRARVRRNVNFWLAFLGKWSLADVLVMSAVLALFDIEINMPLTKLWSHLQTDFMPLCDAICVKSFDNTTNISAIDIHNASAPLPLSNCSVACEAIDAAAHRLVTPSLLPSSQLHVNLHVEGLAAMYAFCVGVLISITTSVWVDTIDDERRERRGAGGKQPAALAARGAPLATIQAGASASEARLEARLLGGAADGTSSVSDPPTASDQPAAAYQPAAAPAASHPAASEAHALARQRSADSARSLDAPPSTWTERHHERLSTRRGRLGERCLRGLHVLLVVVQLVTVLGTFTLPAFERRIEGSIGRLVANAGIDLTSRVSLWDLPALTARGGGLDYLMAATFTVFIIAAPVARSLSLLALLLLPLPRHTARRLNEASRRIVAYTALDVMLIATPLIGIAFGPMSETLIGEHGVPLCVTLDRIYGTSPTCLRIDVIPAVGYWYNVAAIVMMFLSGFDGSPTSKFIHRRLYAHDSQPPPSCSCDEEGE